MTLLERRTIESLATHEVAQVAAHRRLGMFDLPDAFLWETIKAMRLKKIPVTPGQPKKEWR